MERKIVYVEPADYFPKEIRKKYKLGEYAETNVEKERTMDKKKLKEIAKQVVVYLETLPDGTELSTWQATKNSYGIDNLEDIDLFEIDKQLHIIAKKAGIELDSSKYNDCVVGLPFNIPFVINHKL